MPMFGKSIFGNPQALPQQSPPSYAPQQFGGGNYTPGFGGRLQRFLPLMGGAGGMPMPQGITRFMNQYGGSQLQQPMQPAQGFPTQGYPAQGVAPQGYPAQAVPSQGYPAQGFPPQGYPAQAAPSQGYPAQGFPSQGHPAQGFPSQGYPSQGYIPQNYPQGYNPEMQVQPAWEQPKKGGIKGFISNLMAKRKR